MRLFLPGNGGKVGDAVAIVSGVKNFEEMLAAKVKGFSPAAAERGVTMEMNGREALLKLVWKETFEMDQKQAELNRNLAQMLKGGVIMDVTTPEQAKIAEDAGACAVMELERNSSGCNIAIPVERGGEIFGLSFFLLPRSDGRISNLIIQCSLLRNELEKA